jgi:hypothetical protein
MTRLRTVLAWLLLLAIPMQAMAAASMLYCGPAAKAAMRLQQAAGAQQHKHHHGEGAAAGHHESHAGHHTAAPADSKAADGSLPDSSHKCGVCAACCHSIAIAQMPQVIAVSTAPQAIRDEPPAPMHSRPSPVPDKPPRA